MNDDVSREDKTGGAPDATRRRALMLGAVGAASVMSIRPALAQTAGSVLACDIPVPDAGRAGGYIAADGSVVPAGTQGAFAPPTRPLKGEDVRRAMAGGSTLPGVEHERSRAYLKYVSRLQRGTAGVHVLRLAADAAQIGVRWRAPAADALKTHALDDLTAIYHRASGMTHVVTSPAPEILAALAGEALTLDALLAALARDYALGDADRDALAARVEELAAAGLVMRA